jgi:hypothetical protein
MGMSDELIEVQQLIEKNFFLLISYTIIKKVFQDYSSPLYGRLSHMITLDYLPVIPLYKALNISWADFIKFWNLIVLNRCFKGKKNMS